VEASWPRSLAVSANKRCTDRPNGQVSDIAQTSTTSAPQVSDAVPSAGSDTLSQSLNESGTTQTLTGQSGPTTDTAAITPASSGSGSDGVEDGPGAAPDRVADTSDTHPPAFANGSATLGSEQKRLSAAVDIVRTHGPLSGSDMAKHMGRYGHPMPERTGLRWRDRAEEHQPQHQNLASAP
jgi:hypothetical protein